MPRAVIAGGGLAGLACAKRLTDAGFAVELVEAEPQLGGRTASWQDPAGRNTIESGIHSFFGFYDRLRDLLESVGADMSRIVTWSGKVAVLQPRPQYSFFGIDPVRNLAGAIAGAVGNNHLIGPRDKLALGITFARGLLVPRRHEQRTIADLAHSSGLGRSGMENILRPLVRSLHFLEPEELSAYALMSLVKHGMTRPLQLRAGTFRGGMTEVMIAPIARWLAQNGATMRTSTPVTAIRYQAADGGRVSGFELAGGKLLTGDVYISALPIEAVQQLLPSEVARIPYFANIRRIDTAPAVSVQLWFGHRFVPHPQFIFMARSPMIVSQDQSHITFPRPGSRISCQMVDRSIEHFTDQQYIDLALRELHRCIPASAGARLESAVVVRHRAIAMKPGTERLRPWQESPLGNFYLCGDYTKQDWFTTMEGATRSGQMAVERIVERMSSR